MTFDRRKVLSALDRATLALAELRLLVSNETEATSIDPVQQMAVQLRRACAERSLDVLPDGFVSEAAAGELIGRKPGTLRNWRSEHRPINFRRRMNRPEYALTDLAAFLIKSSEDPDF